MLLNAIGVLLGPFIGLAVSHKVIVGQVGRAVGIAVLLVVSHCGRVGDCHELVGQAQVQMALVGHRTSCPLVSSRLGPSDTICRRSLRRSGVAVAGNAAVGDARGVRSLE